MLIEFIFPQNCECAKGTIQGHTHLLSPTVPGRVQGLTFMEHFPMPHNNLPSGNYEYSRFTEEETGSEVKGPTGVG